MHICVFVCLCSLHTAPRAWRGWERDHAVGYVACTRTPEPFTEPSSPEPPTDQSSCVVLCVSRLAFLIRRATRRDVSLGFVGCLCFQYYDNQRRRSSGTVCQEMSSRATTTTRATCAAAKRVDCPRVCREFVSSWVWQRAKQNDNDKVEDDNTTCDTRHWLSWWDGGGSSGGGGNTRGIAAAFSGGWCVMLMLIMMMMMVMLMTRWMDEHRMHSLRGRELERYTRLCWIKHAPERVSVGECVCYWGAQAFASRVRFV